MTETIKNLNDVVKQIRSFYPGISVKYSFYDNKNSPFKEYPKDGFGEPSGNNDKYLVGVLQNSISGIPNKAFMTISNDLDKLLEAFKKLIVIGDTNISECTLVCLSPMYVITPDFPVSAIINQRLNLKQILSILHGDNKDKMQNLYDQYMDIINRTLDDYCRSFLQYVDTP